ncbi:3'-5' exoribonuclease domain-containing protein [Acinetobacter sp. P1(2025)]|uniref:3'-5' exoribonuclease domain-containing protein n=1 Tax=Acinetobacter sp. P1(2025) TaxID=3446120 RepID=UPI003F53357F
MLKRYSVIIDAETLATTPNAKVTEFSAIIFDHVEKNILGHKTVFFDVASQNGYVCPETLQWRIDNNVPDNGEIDRPNYEILKEFIDFIGEFVERNKKETSLYANGSNFDFPILQSLVADVNSTKPTEAEALKTSWNFYNEMCLRSIAMALHSKQGYLNLKADSAVQALGYIQVVEQLPFVQFKKHNSLHDCIFEACILDACYEKIEMYEKSEAHA